MLQSEQKLFMAELQQLYDRLIEEPSTDSYALPQTDHDMELLPDAPIPSLTEEKQLLTFINDIRIYLINHYYDINYAGLLMQIIRELRNDCSILPMYSLQLIKSLSHLELDLLLQLQKNCVKEEFSIPKCLLMRIITKTPISVLKQLSPNVTDTNCLLHPRICDGDIMILKYDEEIYRFLWCAAEGPIPYDDSTNISINQLHTLSAFMVPVVDVDEDAADEDADEYVADNNEHQSMLDQAPLRESES